MSLTLWRTRPSLPTLIPGNGGFGRMRDEMDRTFNRFFAEPLGFLGTEPDTLRSEGWIAPIDVSETDSEVVVRAEIPGIAAKDVDISVVGNTLSISGEKSEQEEKKGEDFFQCERRFGSFRRVIGLPDTADPDKVSAESDNGVVTIHVAKKPGVRPKQIEVKPVGKKVTVTS